MPVLSSTPWWVGPGAGYLHFVGLVAWLMCALLALSFLRAREPLPHAPFRRPGWIALGVAFLLFAAAALTRLLEIYGLWQAPAPDDIVATLCTSAGTLLLLALSPTPGGWIRPNLWRALALAVAALPVPVLFWFPGGEPWAALLPGVLGGWLLTTAADRGTFFDRAVSPGVMARTLGGALLTLALARAAALLPPPGALASVVILALGASVTASALWFVFLRARTLPHVRQRRSILGLNLVWLLPLTQLFVLAAGFLAMRASVHQAEIFVARRLVDELRAVVTALDLHAAAASADEPARSRDRLRDLLASSPAYRAAAAWNLDAGGAQLVSTASPEDSEAVIPPLDLLPQDHRELEATRQAHAFVRWMPAPHPSQTQVVMLPLTRIASGVAASHLSIAVEDPRLGDIVASQRLQALALVTVFDLAAGLALFAMVRSLNEAELRALQEPAESENHARNELLALVSHEVRTPLQNVLGYAELAAMEPLSPATAGHVRAIRTHGAALLRIVQDILDLSALRTGRLPMQPEPVAVRALAEEVRQSFADRAARKDLQLSVQVDAAVPAVVLVDRVRLFQVLVNLVGNAIKFTTRGGVSLSIGVEDVPPPEIGWASLEFRIADSGPGIPPGQQRRVFEPFRKLRQAGAGDGSGGVGLGLAICEHIVVAWRGRISVESTVGGGSTFRVQVALPRCSEAALARHIATNPEGAAPAPPPTILAGLRVLVVDDHPFVRDLLRDALQRLGADVAACADGASALAEAKRTAFDVALLDLNLPDREPAAMLAGLRPNGRSPLEPWIVGLSAGATEQKIQEALDHGMNDFLLKPVRLAGLAETLRLSPAGKKIKSATVAHPISTDPRIATAAERAALLAEATPAVARIAQACDEGATSRVRLEAHYLANSCIMLGLHTAHRLCRCIEDAAAQEDIATLRGELADLRLELARAQTDDRAP